MPYSIFFFKEVQKFIRFDRAKSAKLYYRDYSIDLLNNERSEDGILSYLSELERRDFYQDSQYPRVSHLFYELGYIINQLDHLVIASTPLAIIIEYGAWHEIKIQEDMPFINSLETISELSLDSYCDKFNRVYSYLLDGDSYQVNLTHLFDYSMTNSSFEETYKRIFSQVDQLSAYAHLTYLPSLNQGIISNSPECLFQLSNSDELYTMPIKGTYVLKDQHQKKQAWERLSKDQKEQGELFMIIDLLRNDLARISTPTARVVQKKASLVVPGLLHQYALIALPKQEHVSEKDVIEAMFPGGSITGAPKMKTMEIIHDVEDAPRGIYCGSTWLQFRGINAASINIRTAWLDIASQELSYGAGGGVTLMSKVKSEYSELQRKRESFLNLL